MYTAVDWSAGFWVAGGVPPQPPSEEDSSTESNLLATLIKTLDFLLLSMHTNSLTVYFVFGGRREEERRGNKVG